MESSASLKSEPSPEVQAPEPALAAVSKPAPARQRDPRRAFAYVAAAAAAFVLGLGVYLFATRNHQSTDDAEVEADVVPVAPRVGGSVIRVLVQDNQRVKVGQVLFELDPADYQARELQAEADLALAQAQAQAAHAQERIIEATAQGGLTSAQASLSGSSVSVAAAKAQVDYAQAALARAQADQNKAAADHRRAQALFEAKAISQDRMDAAQAAFDSATAQLEGAKSSLEAAKEQLLGSRTRVTEAEGRLASAKPADAQILAAQAQAQAADARMQSSQSALALAKLQLDYTKVTASVDGEVSRVKLKPGALLQPGQAVMELVPDEVYVEANFKETQIGRMKPGQKVAISVDAFPGKSFRGVVESLSGGTGARFSLLPPDNASGNFVKVVQRVPVRIKLTDVPKDVQLQAGLSVTVTVYED
jgi:membrane fusion protein (multidrug efflux system)